MSSVVDGRSPGRVAVEWSEDRENIFADGQGTGIENDVRAFRAAIVASWAAAYARRRASGDDPELAMSDLRRWAHAYFQDDDDELDGLLEPAVAGAGAG
jgi:hypothetical protein